jgi:hypothetical protein
LGAQTFVLVSAAQLARGVLYREPVENRLNLTSLQKLAASCSN